MNYYNENEPKVATWLRELILQKLIPEGKVDTRSIKDVVSSDLKGFTQCHFFAGIGGWPRALQIAGWPEDRPVWTGSCPCQPFSAAGKRKGIEDERHLWPIWFNLIRECKPPVVFGEQVAAAIGKGWIDLVFSDLENEGYACGAAVLPACSVGAPHKRDRIWFVADSQNSDRRSEQQPGSEGCRRAKSGGSSELGNTNGAGPQTRSETAKASGRGNSTVSAGGGLAHTQERRLGIDGSASWEPRHDDECRPVVSMVNTNNTGPQGQSGDERNGSEPGRDGSEQIRSHWDSCGWVDCRDGKARPIEPGSPPLADGVPARVVRLRGYGNAIVPQVAAAFVKSFTEMELA